jgi:hypothetical protein
MYYREKSGTFHHPIDSESYQIVGEAKDEKPLYKLKTTELTINR